MPQLDVIDETFVRAAPADVAAALHDPDVWRRMFPGLELHVFQDRGDEGLRFTVTGEMVGTNELWVEPWGDGAIVHYYLRADLTRRGSATEVRLVSPAKAVRARTKHCVRVKSVLNEIKDTLEGRSRKQPR